MPATLRCPATACSGALVAPSLCAHGVRLGARAAAGRRQPAESASGPAEARNLLNGLDDALPRIADAGVGPGTLTDTSHLYSALLGYTYVDSCGEPARAPRPALAAASARQARCSTRRAPTSTTPRRSSRRAVGLEPRVTARRSGRARRSAPIPLLRQARATLAPIATDSLGRRAP